jgi:hypothetical protein
MVAQRTDMPKWECLDLLRRERVGRLGIIDAGCPLALPVNYAIVGDGDDVRVVVRTAPGTLLGSYEGPASLEVDEIDLERGQAWSVLARGMLHHVYGEHALPDTDPLVGEGRHQWATLALTAMSGRRFHVQQSSDGYSVEWELIG